MLEALTLEDLAARMAISADGERLHLAPLANAVRRCVLAWGRPIRQRVSGYLHRQLLAMGYDADGIRDQVRTAIDGLLDIEDIASLRIDGKASLVFTLPRLVTIDENNHILLGRVEAMTVAPSDERYNNAIARHLSVPPDDLQSECIDFDEWVGPGAYLRHFRRRSGVDEEVSLGDFWRYLTRVLEQEGAPIDREKVVVLGRPPGWRGGFFGRHDKLGDEGRWTRMIAEGLWCAVRAGRNAHEWHPILIDARTEPARAIDLYSWDEWAWALRGRGMVMGAPERVIEQGDTLQFEQPIPDQFLRALRLLGGPSSRAWTWQLSSAARTRFRRYCERLA